MYIKEHRVFNNIRRNKSNKNILLINRPRAGKLREFNNPNILNILLLKMRGYTIKVLNLDNKSKSTHYNPFKYIRKTTRVAYDVGDDFLTEEALREDDVMSLINIIFKNTKSESIQQQTGDPFWKKAEMIFLQSIFYYILFCLPEEEKNFISVMKLIEFAAIDEHGKSRLDYLFEEWAKKEPDNVGVKQYELFKTSRGRRTNAIVVTATARLAVFNIKEIADMTKDDEMELYRLGHPGKEGKIAWLISTKPKNSAFNCLVNIFYTQLFTIKENSYDRKN